MRVNKAFRKEANVQLLSFFEDWYPHLSDFGFSDEKKIQVVIENETEYRQKIEMKLILSYENESTTECDKIEISKTLQENKFYLPSKWISAFENSQTNFRFTILTRKWGQWEVQDYFISDPLDEETLFSRCFDIRHHGNVRITGFLLCEKEQPRRIWFSMKDDEDSDND